MGGGEINLVMHARARRWVPQDGRDKGPQAPATLHRACTIIQWFSGDSEGGGDLLLMIISVWVRTWAQMAG